MPGGDGTGPVGAGFMTGRGMGYCAGRSAVEFANPGWRRGFGRGLGLGFRGGYGRGRAALVADSPYRGPNCAGRGYGPPFGPTPSRQAERERLQDEAGYVEDTLRGIRNRLAELDPEKTEE
ncbi:MAG: DUF5320 domain-containing protein [Proteobacteria bacterium]|nr:DUF5320 domain-containing protein [Pseudomonadota bacterium]